MECWKAEQRLRKAIVISENKREEREEVRRLLRQQELENSRYAEKSEIEYRSCELRDFLFREREHLRENENIVQVDGTYYIRSTTDFGDIIGHKTLDTWRAERDAEYSQPLEFDNNDYGKIYDSIVDSDYRNRLEDEYREYRTDYKDDPEELGLDDRAPYDEDKYVEWRKEGDELVEKNKDMLSWLKDSILLC